jgi:hypothetical protein
MKRPLFSIFVAAEPELAPLGWPMAESLGPLLENAPPRSAHPWCDASATVTCSRLDNWEFCGSPMDDDEACYWRSSTKREKGV